MLQMVESTAVGKSVPGEIAVLLGRAPLVHGEDPAHYDALLEDFAGTIGPGDIIEWIYVKELTDAVWDIRRLRQWKSAVVNSGAKTALAGLLTLHDGTFQIRSIPDASHVEVAEHWFTDGPHKRHILDILTRHGLDDGASVAGVSAARQLQILVVMDNLLDTAQRRYGRALQQIGGYRAEWRQKLHKAATAVIEAVPDGFAVVAD